MKRAYVWIFSAGVVLMLAAIAVEGHAGEKAASILTPVLSSLAAAALCLSYLTQQLKPRKKN